MEYGSGEGERKSDMISSSRTKLKFAAYVIIIVHLLLVILHATAHQRLNVDPSTLQLSFIVTVIMAAPVVAGLLMPKFEVLGSVLFTLSMAGSFIFGFYNHFIGRSIDHVAEVSHLQPEIWSTIFQLSAGGLALAEAVGTIAGVWLLFSHRPKVETKPA